MINNIVIPASELSRDKLSPEKINSLFVSWLKSTIGFRTCLERFVLDCMFGICNAKLKGINSIFMILSNENSKQLLSMNGMPIDVVSLDVMKDKKSLCIRAILDEASSIFLEKGFKVVIGRVDSNNGELTISL